MEQKSDIHLSSYRQCFSTDSGKRVLAHLLREAGYFDTDMKTTEELAVLNYAKKIIKNLGICTTVESTEEFTQKLFEMKSIQWQRKNSNKISKT